jgi:hypothetical protein
MDVELGRKLCGDRNRDIARRCLKRTVTLRELANEYGLCISRVWQIIQKEIRRNAADQARMS